jgi:cell division protein FtsI (penicillin-binding protein 3)
MLGRTDRRLRMLALLVVFALFGSAIMLRLSYWQVGRPDLIAVARATMVTPDPLPPMRANILDRAGHIMAQTIPYDQLVAYPVSIRPEQRAEVVATLAGILDLDASEQATYLAQLSREGDEWESLALRLTQKQSALVAIAQDEGSLPGIGLEPKAARAYRASKAGTSLASQLLGFVAGASGGSAGVEKAYEARLSGAEAPPPDVASLTGAAAAATGGLEDHDPLAGLSVPDLRLTVDKRLQSELEATIYHVLIQNEAKTVSAIVMDPYTGAILASASAPGYDANDYSKVYQRDPGMVRDRNVSDTYEPGSVMKMFTAAAALQTGVVKLDTIIHDQVVLKFPGDVKIHNFDRGSTGDEPFKEIIAQSRNIGTAKVARSLAPGNYRKAARILYDYWKRLNVIGRTGIDLPAESPGIVREPDAWTPVDLANHAFGQGVSVTLMQLATGYAPFMNGGYRVHPHVVMDDASTEPELEPERVLDAKVAAQTLELLTYVTGSQPTYANGSLIPGYVVGGKTGTAQIWDPEAWNRETHSRGNWKDDRFNSSFVGFVGSDKPEVLIAVRIEEAKPVKLSPSLTLRIPSYSAYQLIARKAINVLDIRKAKDPLAGLPVPGTAAARASEFSDELRAALARKRASSRSDPQAGPQGAGSIGGPDGTEAGASRRHDRAGQVPDAEGTSPGGTTGRRSDQGRKGGPADTDT